MKRKILAIFGFCILISYQNCGPVAFSSSSISSYGPSGGLNPAINTIQPALVARATGCVMCHGKTSSNVITDFGSGDNYFFGGAAGVLPSGLTNDGGGSIYGDYSMELTSLVGDQNWASSTLAQGSTVYVPNTSTSSVNVVSGDTTLQLYLEDQLSQDPNAPEVTVQQVSSMYIGAPTSSRILSVSGLSSGGLKFLPSSPNSPAFSGISSNGTYYTNTGTIVCEGDLAIDGLVWLNNPTIQTTNGCRLYVTGSVFMQGPLVYTNNNSTQNFQITSSKFIGLGIGHNTCKNTGTFPDSITERLTYSSDSRFAGFFTRTLGTPEQMINSLLTDANAIDTVGSLYDASCGPGGRGVGFSHLLLNAPVIYSRYQGQFNGVIVGEIILLSLESLNYIFDPVFSSALILPLLDNSDYLTIQD